MVTDGKEILNAKVVRMYPNDDQPSNDDVTKVSVSWLQYIKLNCLHFN